MLPGDRIIRNGQFKGWRPQLYGLGLSGRTLGLIGMGAVGQAIARRSTGFEMKVVYHDAIPLAKEKEETLGLRNLPLEALLGQSDFVMPLLPLKPDTFHLINFHLGKPPALPGDSQSLTFPGIDKSRKKRKPPSCEPLKVQEPGGFQWTTGRV